MNLTERKKKVLRSVVDLYIRTAEPVGSKAITALPDMNYSSATIRNEMADLTALGYLEQPHTSAGRIPSAAGYRLYVDELMMDYQGFLLVAETGLDSRDCGRLVARGHNSPPDCCSVPLVLQVMP